MRRAIILGFSALLLMAQEVRAHPANLCSLEKEAALCKYSAAEFRRQNRIIEGPRIQQYLKDLEPRLARHIPEAPHPFTFAAAFRDAACPNIPEPVAFPGGHVFVPASLILAAQDESEFAAMLAHAMAHVALRHATRQATQGTVADYTSIPLIFTGGWTSGCDDRPAVPLGFLKTMRSHELEADAAAAAYVASAGYDPAALVRFIERTQPPTSGVHSRYPARDQQMAALKSAIQALPAAAVANPTGEFAAIQRGVRAIIPSPPDREPPSLNRNRRN